MDENFIVILEYSGKTQCTDSLLENAILPKVIYVTGVPLDKLCLNGLLYKTVILVTDQLKYSTIDQMSTFDSIQLNI